MIVERRLARARQTGSLCALIALSVFGFACSKAAPVGSASPQVADGDQGVMGTKGKKADAPTLRRTPATSAVGTNRRFG